MQMSWRPCTIMPGMPRILSALRQQLAFLEIEILEEEARANPREGNGLGRIGKSIEQVVIGQQRGDIAFPEGPFARGGEARFLIVAGQAAMIGLHEIAALRLGDEAGEGVPLLGHDFTGAVFVKPGLLLLPGEEHAAQHQLADALRMGLA